MRTFGAVKNNGCRLPYLVGGLVAICALSAALAYDASGFVGVWKFEKSAFIGKATMYTLFSEGGTCTQVVKATIAGTTHWATDRCSWSIENAALSIRVTGSVTTPKQVGTSTVVTIESLSAETFSYKKDGDLEKWVRVDAVPAEYTGKLDAETRPDRQ